MNRLVINTLYIILVTFALQWASAAAPLLIRVQDEHGAPYSRAVVYLFRPNAAHPEVTHTDKEGMCRFALPAGDDFPESEYQTSIFADGYAPTGGVLHPGTNDFTLRNAGSLQGMIATTGGAPVSGVSVSAVLAVDEQGAAISLATGDISTFNTLLSAHTATSDAQGRWSLPGLPLPSRVLLHFFHSDYAFLNRWVLLDEDTTSLQPVIAQAPGRIEGRITGVTGAPMAGMRVHLGAPEEMLPTHTDTEGFFAFPQVYAEREWTVYVDDPQGRYVAPPLAHLPVVSGQTTFAPIMLIDGALISGTVIDAQQGAPLPNVLVECEYTLPLSRVVVSARTDQHGRYRLRVLPGMLTLRVREPAPGYYLLTPSRSLRAEANIFMEQEPFVLARGYALRGVIRHGAPTIPPTGMSISTTIVDASATPRQVTAVSDADGRFILDGLPPGRFRLIAGVQRFGAQQRGEGETLLELSPQEIAVPQTQPLKFSLREITPASKTGRVVDTAGHPVSGASVQVLMRGDDGQIMLEELSTSDQGVFRVLAPSHDDVAAIASAEKPGYVWYSGGESQFNGKQPGFTDIRLSPLRGRLSVTVLNEQGIPVPGALIISPDAGMEFTGRTDDAGQFTFAPVVDDQLTVLAAYQHHYGIARAQAGEQMHITLEKAAVVDFSRDESNTLGSQQVTQAFQQANDADYYAWRTLPMELSIVDAEEAVKLMERSPLAVQAPMMAGILSRNAQQSETQAKIALNDLPKIDDPSLNLYATVNVASALVAGDRPAAQQLYAAARGQLPGVPAGMQYIAYARLARLAQQLQNGDADWLLSRALAFAQQRPQPAQAVRIIAETVAEASPQLAERVIRTFPEPERALALAMSIRRIALYDAPAAQRLLTQIDAKNAVLADEYGLAAQCVVRAIAGQQPRAAYEIARQVQSRRYRPLALALAAQPHPREQAIAIFRQAATAALESPTPVETLARIAAMASTVDAQFGLTLFSEARRYLTAQYPTREAGVASFAYYYRMVDAAESRVLLEAECLRYRNRPDTLGGGWSIVPVLLALATFDLAYAMQMAEDIAPLQSPNARYDVQRKLAQYAFATPEIRAAIPLQRWSIPDTWTPGQPEEW